MNLNTRNVTELAGSKGLFSPRWSPDGRYVAAYTNSDYKLMLFDFKTQKWEKLSDLLVQFPNWSNDSRYVYFRSESPAGNLMGFYRVHVNTLKVDQVAAIENAQEANGVPGFAWTGVSPDGAPLIAREAGTEEIYALDVKLP